MDLRYGKIDENVLRRSVKDVILHEGQRLRALKAWPVGSYSMLVEHVQKELAEGAGIKISAEPVVCRTYGAGSEIELSGKLAVIRNANRLAAEKMRAEMISPVILLPPGTKEETLRKLIRQIAETAFILNIGIAEVHAEVTDAVLCPVVTGTMTGRAFHSDSDRKTDKIAANAGMEIIAAGPVGLEGTRILLSECRSMLQDYFPESLLMRMEGIDMEMCVMRTAEIAAGAGADTMVNLSGGGLYTGLWELSQKTRCGFKVDLPSVPLLQETIEITNYLGINPYGMRSEGCILLAGSDGEKIIQQLSEADIPAVRIGTLETTRDKVIQNGDEVRYLDRPQADTLDQFLYERALSKGTFNKEID